MTAMKRILIVTGASSPRRQFAKQLSASRDADELAHRARNDLLQEVAQELNADLADEILPRNARKAAVAGKRPAPRTFPLDLAGTRGVKDFARLLASESEAAGPEGLRIEALVNNAGFGTYGAFMDTDIDRQLEMVELNSVSLTGICHYAIPHMGEGSLLINVASLASFIPLGNFAVYGATKAYVLSFSIALAAEIADRGIFVSTLCPGPVDTEFARVASNGARKTVVDGKTRKVVAHCLSQAPGQTNLDHGAQMEVQSLHEPLRRQVLFAAGPSSSAPPAPRRKGRNRCSPNYRPGESARSLTFAGGSINVL